MKINLRKDDLGRQLDKQLPVFNIFYPSQSDAMSYDDMIDTVGSMGQLDLSGHRSAALYFHFPFCETICNFCPFTRGKYQNHDIISQYLTALRHEIVVKARHQNLKSLNVRSIFVGGGTPSLLSSDEILVFGRILQDNFDLNNLVEFSFECEVKSVTEDKVKALRDIGVTNARFGLQTFDPFWRSMFDLTATLPQIYESANLLQKHIHQTSFDILYAMNGHNILQFENDLKKAAEIGNNLIDVYPIDNVVTQIRLHQKTRQAGLAPLSADTRFEMNDFLRDSMRDKGFLPHNGHGYVRSSSQEIAANPIVTRSYRFEYHDHVYGYSDHIVLGFGVNAISLLQGCVLTKTNNRKDYIAGLSAGDTVAGQISFFGADIAASRSFVTRLAYHGYIEKSKVDLSLAPPETISALKELLEADLVRETEDEILLTKDGWQWYVNIMYYCMPLSQRKLLNAFLIHKLSQNGREVTKEQVVFA